MRRRGRGTPVVRRLERRRSLWRTGFVMGRRVRRVAWIPRVLLVGLHTGLRPFITGPRLSCARTIPKTVPRWLRESAPRSLGGTRIVPKAICFDTPLGDVLHRLGELRRRAVRGAHLLPQLAEVFDDLLRNGLRLCLREWRVGQRHAAHRQRHNRQDAVTHSGRLQGSQDKIERRGGRPLQHRVFDAPFQKSIDRAGVSSTAGGVGASAFACGFASPALAPPFFSASAISLSASLAGPETSSFCNSRHGSPAL
jgi:hypothetical protein